MKVTVEEDRALTEPEVVIRCRRMDEGVARLMELLRLSDARLTGVKDGETHILDPGQVLYIDTADRATFLYTADEGSVLDQYLTELKHLIDTLPDESIVLRTAYYTRAANAYMNSGCYDKAIVADKALLDIIDDMEKKYRSDGRRFRDMSRF